MPSPSDCSYTESHEWIKIEGDTATLGITTFAVNELTDITYVEMKSAGTSVGAGDGVGEVESVKATSDIYSPLAGEIIETNDSLESDPSLINTDPFGGGWLVKIKLAGDADTSGLMDAATYDEKYPA